MAIGPDLTVQVRSMGFGSGPALLSDFSLSVAPGQVVALIGPSGVGKTTVLRIMAGVETGFDGVARVGGTLAHRAPVPGYVFQDARLLPWFNAAQNLRALCPGLRHDQVEAALQAVGLAGQGAAMPRQMSGGMQRRLALARALAINPGLLLLDEPFAALDGALADEMAALLAGILQHGRATAVLVTHDPRDAARLAHRAVVLTGRPARILADLTFAPAHSPVPPRSLAEQDDILRRIALVTPPARV